MNFMHSFVYSNSLCAVKKLILCQKNCTDFSSKCSTQSGKRIRF